MVKGKIYILIDPNTDKIKYVGMTKLSLEHRLSLHLSEKKKSTHKSHWIHSLKKTNKKPIIKQIDSSDNVLDLAMKEMYWIQHYLKNDEKLTNHILTFSARPYKSFLDKTAKQVTQYDLEGNMIAKYDSANAAACDLGFCDQNGRIYSICNGNKKKYTFKGFVFRFENEPFDKYNIVKRGDHETSDKHKKYLSNKAKERNKNNDSDYYKKIRAMVVNKCGPKGKSVIDIVTGQIYETLSDCSLKTKVPMTTISRHCKSTVKKPLFKFQDIVHS